ncbi:MAG TPA: DUF2189 domain-containing protein [Xanthobacteraceae bacterium]|nr:DUF2189 domain-containing protein [Xanthobacteraceae bacterium]
MTQLDIILPTEPARALPAVRHVTFADLADSVKKGWQDFMTRPTHIVFLCAIYPLAGVLLFSLTSAFDLFTLVYPLAAGFALIGPIAALGLYEVSRRREMGLDSSLRHAFDFISTPSLGPIVALSLVLVALFGTWIAVAQSIYIANFGYLPVTSVSTFLNDVLTTQQGHRMIFIGNAVGFLFALLAASISVVSFPLLLDRHVGFWAAVATSLRVVVKNPVTMAAWFLFVAITLLIGSLPMLVGLAIVLPVLGHATWHLYRKAVEPDPGSRPAYHAPSPKPKRYAAEFPASLFARSDHNE